MIQEIWGEPGKRVVVEAKNQVYFVCPQLVLLPFATQMLAFYTTLTAESVNTC